MSDDISKKHKARVQELMKLHGLTEREAMDAAAFESDGPDLIEEEDETTT